MYPKICLILALIGFAESCLVWIRVPYRPPNTELKGKSQLKQFFSDSCQPECENGFEGLSLMVSNDADCPTNFLNRKILKGRIFVKPKNFCDAEVSVS